MGLSPLLLESKCLFALPESESRGQRRRIWIGLAAVSLAPLAAVAKCNANASLFLLEPSVPNLL